MMPVYEWNFHIFSDNIDTFTKDLVEALKIYHQWKKNIGRVRLHLVVYNNEECDDPIIEECLMTYGDFPY